MSYMDEEIVKQANAYKKETRGSIYEQIFIKGEEVKFEKTVFSEDGIEVWLPVEFIDIPEFIMKLKYPSENRPKYIKTCKQGGVDFGLNPLPLDASDAMTQELGEQMYQITKKFKSDATFIEKQFLVNEKTQHRVFWFDFVSKGIDGLIYNFMGVTEVSGKELNYVFNCPAEDMEVWKPVAMEVFESITTYEES